MLSFLVLPVLVALGCGSSCDDTKAWENETWENVQPVAQVQRETLSVRAPAEPVAVDQPITLEFSDDVIWRGGTIHLRVFDGVAYQTVETFDGRNIGQGTKGSVAVSGNMLTLTPTDDLEMLASYAVRISPGSVVGANGLPFKGINNDTATLIRTGARFEPPSINKGDYDDIKDGYTYGADFVPKSNTLYINCTFTRNVDVSNVKNVAFVNSTFTNRRGYGISISDASNIKIAGNTFRKIRDTAILLRRSGSTDNVAIFNNDIAEVGGDGIHAAKRFKRNVDHTNLVIYKNTVKNVGLKKGELYHGIYTQTSGVKIINNRVTGWIDSNGISIRSDGLVWGNYVDIVSGRDKGSGIKYYSDHKTGRSKTLIIADNTIIGSRLYSAVELDMASQAIPRGMAPQEWVVNRFRVLRNDVDARFGYVVEQDLKEAAWSQFELVGDANWSDPYWKVVR